ncbi:MAG: hypothetical protein AAF827_22275 [Cyanobacteria bacterium P01_D01_bin.6]
MTRRLTELLRSRRSPAAKSKDLVFLACEGGYIDYHNFRNRAWKAVLDALDMITASPALYNAPHVHVRGSRIGVVTGNGRQLDRAQYQDAIRTLCGQC